MGFGFGVNYTFGVPLPCGTIPFVNKTVRTLVSLTVTLAFFAIAFASGYVVRGRVDLSAQAAAHASLGGSAAQADLGVYWQAWELLDRDFYGPQPDMTQRTYGSIKGLVAAFDDRYTYFVEPEPHQRQSDTLRGSFGGIGAWIDQGETGYLLRPMRGQPAALAGVKERDLLLKVDDTPITLDLSADDVVALVRGPIGSQVCLSVERTLATDATPEPSQQLRLCMVRAEIQIPSVEWRLLNDKPETAMIGYIRHSNFSGRSAQEMRLAVEELLAQGADRFILDLRGNPGGLLDAAVEVSSLWLDGGAVLVEKHANGEERTFEADDGDLSEGRPLVVIVDGGSASASEIVAGALQDRDRAVLVGEQTFGKGSVQLVHELADMSSLHVTTARWYTPDRHGIDGAGLTPDVIITPGTDPLPVAIDVVQELAATP